MKHLLATSPLTWLALLLAAPASAQPQRPPFFAKEPLMSVGSYYYPEQWPHANWARDIKKMAEVGFQFTHYGEFAWSFIEPEEGKFDFTWLDEAVALAHQNGVLLPKGYYWRIGSKPLLAESIARRRPDASGLTALRSTS